MKNLNITIGIVLVMALQVLTSCDNDRELPNRQWQMVWQDEFDSGLDAAKWNYDIGAGGWGNNELQTYTDSEDNLIVRDGVLEITAHRNGNAFTSARINTKGLFKQAYGRFEARMKLPYGPGIWPAFWLLGGNIDEVNWPQCGEIDIMELKGQEPNVIHGSVHGPGYSAGAAVTKSYGWANNRFDKAFHIFAVEWGKDYIDYFVDDVLYQRITPDAVPGKWVYDHAFFIILNLAVGGDYVGFPTNETPFSQTMYVDYVRVYRQLYDE